MNKKKIVFLSSCVRGGGAGWSLYYLIKHLNRNLFEPIVVIPEFGIFEKKYNDLKVKMVIAPKLPERTAQQRFKRINILTKTLSNLINGIGMVQTIFWLKSFIKKEQIDLLYANNMLVKSIGAFSAKFAKKPCIIHIRNLHEKKLEIFFYKKIAKLSSVELIISNSTASSIPITKNISKKIKIIHNGIDIEEYSHISKGTLRNETKTKNKIIIGYTGNIIPRKGLDILIKASAKVIQYRNDTVIVIIGRVPIGSNIDYQMKYSKLASDLGIANKIIFTGFKKDIRPYVQDMDILTLPSRQEPFGRSIIEAMALGKPVVASNIGGIPEIITHGKDGFLCPIEDIDALAKSLDKLIKDKSLRLKIGKEAKATIKDRFNVKKLSTDIQDLIKQILE